MGFERDLGDGLSLALRTPAMATAVRAVAAANIDRLRLWEPWAHDFDPDGHDDEWNRDQLRRFLDGTAIPTVVLRDGAPIGSVSMQLDRYRGAGSDPREVRFSEASARASAREATALAAGGCRVQCEQQL